MAISHLSRPEPAVTALALWSINHYIALIEKTQCTVAIRLQKLRHTQRIFSLLSLHQFGYQVLHALAFAGRVVRPVAFQQVHDTPRA